MLRRLIKALLTGILYAVISIVICWLGPVLLCDVWQLQCRICR